MSRPFAHSFTVALAIVSVFLLTGCGARVDFTPSAVQGAALQGKIFGGQQPIVGAKLYLLAAGTTGYGQPSTSLLTLGISGTDSIGGYVLTGPGGNFSITGDYLCTPATQVYLYAKGGDSGAGANSNIGLMSALGNCPANGTFATSVPFLIMNEVTTVAAAYALAGFATDPTHVSSSGSTQASTGVQNAFVTASNLASLSQGVALAQTPSGIGAVPQIELNTLANILAACVNSTAGSSTCSYLETRTLSSGVSGTAPADTAAIAINIAHNPAVNVSDLFSLSSGTAPFQPSLSMAPNDFTVVIAFNDIGGYPISIDSAGDIWACYEGVQKLSNAGFLLSPANGYPQGGTNYVCASIAVAPDDSVWSISGGASGTSEVGLPTLNRFSNAGTLLTPAGIRNSSFDAADANGNYNFNLLAVDGNGNVWITNDAAYTLSKVTSDGSLVSSFSNPVMGTNYNPYSDIAIDSADNIYVANTYAGNSSYTEFYNSGAAVSGSPFYSNITGGFSSLAIDASGDVWASKQSSNAVFEYTGAGYPAPGILFTDGNAQDNAGPVSSVFDGLGNLWGTRYNFYASGITEISGTGVQLSPVNGFGYVTAPPGYTGQPLTNYNLSLNQHTFAIDSSGNGWASGGTGHIAPQYTYYTSTLYEFVGVAAPVVTPLSYAVKTAALARRP